MPTAEAPVREAEATVRQWVAQHQVTWESDPRREMIDGGSLSVVGYDVRLYGRVKEGAGAPSDEECAATYTHLHAIASAVLDAAGGGVMCHIEGFDASFHTRPDGGWEPEVELTIRLTHAGACARPGDAGEKQAAAAIQAALKRLGAHPGRWPRQ